MCWTCPVRTGLVGMPGVLPGRCCQCRWPAVGVYEPPLDGRSAPCRAVQRTAVPLGNPAMSREPQPAADNGRCLQLKLADIGTFILDGACRNEGMFDPCQYREAAAAAAAGTGTVAAAGPGPGHGSLPHLRRFPVRRPIRNWPPCR